VRLWAISDRAVACPAEEHAAYGTSCKQDTSPRLGCRAATFGCWGGNLFEAKTVKHHTPPAGRVVSKYFAECSCPVSAVLRVSTHWRKHERWRTLRHRLDVLPLAQTQERRPESAVAQRVK